MNKGKKVSKKTKKKKEKSHFLGDLCPEQQLQEKALTGEF